MANPLTPEAAAVLEYRIPAAMVDGLARVIGERVDPIYRGWCHRANIFGLRAKPIDMIAAPTLADLLESVYLQGVLDGEQVGLARANAADAHEAQHDRR